MNTVETEIVRLARGGHSIGRHPDGRVIFVEGGVPGDLAEVELLDPPSHKKEKLRFYNGKIHRLLKPSLHRVEPPCIYFQSCGGCPWQNVAYEEQVRQKKEILRDALVRNGALTEDEALFLQEFVPSPQQLRYRSRITLRKETRKETSSGTHAEIGYNRRGTHDFIPIEDCLIADDRLIPAAQDFVKKTESADLKRFQVAVDSAGIISIGGSFTQVNEPQNQQLQNYVSMLAFQFFESRYDVLQWSVLDLYCGNGNLTFPVLEQLLLAKQAFSRGELNAIKLNAVEKNQESINKANESFHQKSYYNSLLEDEITLSFHQSDVGEWLKNNARLDDAQAEILILDPPRIGCDALALDLIARRKPSYIIYVSCDPMTQARDVRKIRESFVGSNEFYKITSVRGFDLFPHTDHIESVVSLSLHTS